MHLPVGVVVLLLAGLIGAGRLFQIDGSSKEVFEFDLGGTTCKCGDRWDSGRMWQRVFIDDYNGFVMPHVLAPMYFYIILQDVAWTGVLIFSNESLEEVSLMVTGKWGWNMGEPKNKIEPRYDSLIKDTILCGPLGLALGFMIVRISGVHERIADWPVNFASWDITKRNSITRWLFAVAQFYVLSIPQTFLFASPRHSWDFTNWKLLYFTGALPLFLLGLGYVSSTLMPDLNTIQWRTLHRLWAAVGCGLLFFAYLAPFPSNMITAMVGSLLAIFCLWYFYYKIKPTHTPTPCKPPGSLESMSFSEMLVQKDPNRSQKDLRISDDGHGPGRWTYWAER